MTSEDKTPGWVAIFVSVLVCFPCACCAGFYTLYNLAAAFNPEWASQVVNIDEVYPSSMFWTTSLVCSTTTVVGLVCGIVFLVWGLRRVRVEGA